MSKLRYLLIGLVLLIGTRGVILLSSKSSSQLPYPESVNASGKVEEVNLVAEVGTTSISPDQQLTVWSYNNQVPGPEIRITKGDTLKIHFTNKLPQETTIHFHGIRVPNAMDGVPGVTQDLLSPVKVLLMNLPLKTLVLFGITHTFEVVSRLREGCME